MWPMSVYRHFRDKEHLLDAVAAAGAAGVELPAADTDWRRQVAMLAGEARDLLARQPAELRRRAVLSPGMLGLTDAALLSAAGEEHPNLADAAAEVAAALAGTEAFEGGLARVMEGIVRGAARP